MREQKLVQCTNATIQAIIHVAFKDNWFIVAIYSDPTERASFVVFEKNGHMKSEVISAIPEGNKNGRAKSK